jgi:RNA polymerase sigma-70 factor (ECF subfamily)
MEAMVDSPGSSIGVSRPTEVGVPCRADSWRRLFDELARDRLGALEELYDLASSEVFGLALWRTGSADDAADVVQDVFVRVAEQRNKLASVRQPRSWLLTVAHRMAVDVARRRTRRKSAPIEEAAFLSATHSDAERTLDGERASVQLAGLSPKQREVVYLRHFADLTFAAIGRVVGVPTFTAASRYRLGIARLRSLMEAVP